MSLHSGSLQFKTHLEYAFWMLIQEDVPEMQGSSASKYCALETHGFTLDVLQCDGDDFEKPW